MRLAQRAESVEDSPAGRGVAALRRWVEQGGLREPPLSCVPPFRPASAPYGDVVPAALALGALDGRHGCESAAESLRCHLQERRCGDLYPFQRGGLPEAVDTGLVLLGHDDPAAARALQAFADGRGGYEAQRSDAVAAPGVMARTVVNRLWCQADFATTCLVVAHRSAAGLDSPGAQAWLAARVETRGGLFFANPFWTDWFLALALAAEAGTEDLRALVAGEVLASALADGAFGSYDVALSTALALLALDALGVSDPRVERARTRLGELQQRDGWWPAAAPFSSCLETPSERLPAAVATRLALRERAGELVRVGGRVFGVTWWRERLAVVTTALCIRAIGPVRVRATGIARRTRSAPRPLHRRYLCRDAVDYIARDALPPYVEALGVPA
jgi:hypothetical protein